MDCKQFRKQHLAYLDDTLPGEVMATAQQHVLQCDGCAAHDTLVRRSLMVARNLPTLEPSADFQQKLRARLAQCREERDAQREADRLDNPAFARSQDATAVPHEVQRAGRSSRVVVAVAASTVLGLLAYQALQQAVTPELTMQPVIASRPAPVTPSPYLTPEMVQAMSTGNPVWPATMLVEEAPLQAMSAGFSLVSTTH